MLLNKPVTGRLLRCKVLLLAVLLYSLPLNASETDPYESINRKVFAFNEFMDRWFLKPVAKGYRFITPEFVDRGVSNVFDNLGEIRNLLNAGLQGDFRHMGVSTGRFLVNSTVGIAGLVDVANRIGLEEREEDFGQTLGVWGVDSGPYVMLPFFGASSLRDAPARLVDWYTSPVAYIDDETVSYALRALDFIDTRADLIDTEALITGDRYTFIREVYLQQRRAYVNNGEAEDEFDSFDNFDDEEF